MRYYRFHPHRKKSKHRCSNWCAVLEGCFFYLSSFNSYFVTSSKKVRKDKLASNLWLDASRELGMMKWSQTCGVKEYSPLKSNLSDDFFCFRVIGPYLSQNHGPPRNHSQFLQVAWDRPIGWYPSCLTPPKEPFKKAKSDDELQAAAAGLAPAEPLIVRVRWTVEMSKFFLTRREWCVYCEGFSQWPKMIRETNLHRMHGILNNSLNFGWNIW